ncbi:hypothetical protein KDA_44200 [Dictyobacter alpinus]|uniref:Transcription regulator PadR N-terminal domain-containing protein n=1 Tax=Dictyobacter alpinus TaxID=2014873 RepID=A0A402BC87_9CHLR|nr:PadR family transcriptional regulator [Dictyobacter alpinus]GCE28936.1 hypothetical protein KDA_44200 [Dictyobacter alpinus]
MYELIVLSLLMRFPLHGYLIAQIANDMIGPWAKLSNGTLYPLLNRLEKQELIVRANGAGDGEQSVRTFMITEAGRKRFYQVMMDTTSNIGDYQRLFHLKVPYLDLLAQKDRLHLLNHYMNYCQACLLHIKTQSENLLHEIDATNTHNLHFRETAIQTMDHMAALWRVELEWATRLHASQEAAAEPPASEA